MKGKGGMMRLFDKNKLHNFIYGEKLKYTFVLGKPHQENT